jgi:hypothetical protein
MNKASIKHKNKMNKNTFPIKFDIESGISTFYP